VTFNFSQYIQDNIEEALSGVKGENSVKIIGRDQLILEQLAKQVLDEMKQVKGVEDLGVFWVRGQPNLNIKVDRNRAARYGLNAGDVNTVVQAALGGAPATTLLEADRHFDVVVRLPAEYRSTIEAVRNIKVGFPTPAGVNAYVPLSELADITLDTGASFIYREATQRYIPVKFSVRGRDLASTVAEAQQRIANNVKLPNGYRLEWAGEFESLQQARNRLAVIIPTTLILIVMLLYGLFNSLRDSLMALLGIPFAAAGGILGLFAAGLNFSISAAIGFVSLFGVSVMSGILIINGYNQFASGGMSKVEAMLHAAEQQMRPILMMALSACIGLLPAALSTGIGSQVQRPLATVVVGGMLVAPVMLLVLMPVLQTLLLGRENSSTPAAEAEA
jgi:cobalt-zinc-cadmium resistance protein CzcA